MYVVLVFIHLLTGQLVPRTSVVLDKTACEESVPLFEKLYTQGKFEDGPPPHLIKSVIATCIADMKKGTSKGSPLHLRPELVD